MSGPDAATPMARQLGYPLTDTAKRITAEYGWALEGSYVPGRKDVYIVKQLEFGGFVSSAASQCECSVYTTIAPQRIGADGAITAPEVTTRHQCRRIGSALWDEKQQCPDIPRPRISTEQALVALGGTRTDIVIARDQENLARIAPKLTKLYGEIAAALPKVGEPVRWSEALKIEKQVPGKPTASMGAGTGTFVSGTSLLVLKEEGRRAGQIWLVKDTHGHHYLVFERDVTRLKP